MKIQTSMGELAAFPSSPKKLVPHFQPKLSTRLCRKKTSRLCLSHPVIFISHENMKIQTSMGELAACPRWQETYCPSQKLVPHFQPKLSTHVSVEKNIMTMSLTIEITFGFLS